MLKEYIQQVVAGDDLTITQAEAAMNIIMDGEATPAQIGGYLVALRMKGESVSEITGSAMAMRAHSSRVDMGTTGTLIDTAGTGGDGAHTFNISTTAAFVIAAAGYKVAKHGNRAASSRSGSADVLETLGVNLELTPAQVGVCIEEVGIGFMFAPKFHPAMRYAIGPRRELAMRTIFNVLGPLTNPAGATHQLIGVFDPALTETMAQVLNELGSEAAFVVHGHDGLDELTTAGVNRVSELKNGAVSTYSLNAADYGLRPASATDLQGGDPAENAAITRAILAGEDSPRSDIVALNAATALVMNGVAWKTAVSTTRELLSSGKALAKLDALIEKSNAL